MSQPTAPRGSAGKPAVMAPSRTTVALELGIEHMPGRNVVWSAGMAIAWKELVALAGGPIVLADADADDAAATTVLTLNDSPIDRRVVDDASCVARAGFQSRAFLEELRGEVAHKLGAGAAADVPADPAPELFIAYAHLAQRMAFELPLQRASWPLQFRGCIVKSFGLWDKDAGDWEALTRQVRVHHPCYTEADVERMSDAEYDAMYEDSVVELLTKQPDDRLILALLAPGRTLGDTVERALSFVDRHSTDHPHARLDRREKLEVPIVDVDTVRRHHELFGRRVDNAPLRAQQFGEVLEHIRFRLDEGGATLDTRAIGRGLLLPPRELVFAMPFLVMVLRRGAPAPMFALWVENGDVLVPAQRPREAPADGGR